MNNTNSNVKPGTKHVTVTVKETVVEPVGQQIKPQHAIHTHASNTTRELDDLMASLSDFKVCYYNSRPRKITSSLTKVTFDIQVDFAG